MKNKVLSYKKSGVDYSALDYLKRQAQASGKNTVPSYKNSSLILKEDYRGESAYVVESANRYEAFVMEGLGTKNLVADRMYTLTGKTYYDNIAYDAVACIVNDLITVGALPAVLMAYFACGDVKWLNDKKRIADLVLGWEKAACDSQAVWAGGETPTLSGVINPDTIDLAGSCFGTISPKTNLIKEDDLRPEDIIIFIGSSGIHANGLTLARQLAQKLPDGYLTKIDKNTTYGDALLVPAFIYAPLLRQWQDQQIKINYLANITGHGWRKIMRSNKTFTYRITTLPPIPPVLQFICDRGPVSLEEAYGNFNMGAGLAVYINESAADKVIDIARESGFQAYKAGIVEKGDKQVIIEPLKITFKSNTLRLRI